MLAVDTHPLITPRVRKYLTTTGGFDAEAWRAWQVQWFGTGLRAVEARLAGEPGTGRFCHGDVATHGRHLPGQPVRRDARLQDRLRRHPDVTRIMAECETLEAFAAADPSRQAGAPQ